MRIIGILLILIGVPLIGWFGYVELFYLDEIKSGFEEQRIKPPTTTASKNNLDCIFCTMNSFILVG